MAEVTRYEKHDRDAVREICFRTGFLGGDMARIVDNRALFMDLATHCFIDDDEADVFVAREDGHVAGYVFAAGDYASFARRERRYYWARIVSEFAKARLFSGRDSKYYLGLARAYMRGEYAFGEHPEFSAMLHINLLKEYHGKGVGDMLFGRVFDELGKKGVTGAQVHTTSANERALGFFRRHGFREIETQPSRFYRAYGHGIVYNIMMGRLI